MKKDGGPAFPKAEYAVDPSRTQGPMGPLKQFPIYSAGGMSLRDYFAAKALNAIVSSRTKVGEFEPDFHSSWAYRYADAMLKEREK